MLTLLATSLLGGNLQHDLAYSARYYYQGKRKSYIQIYLCNHAGTDRIQLTKNAFDSYAPMWIDRNHLAWVEACKLIPSKFPGVDDRFESRVVMVDIPTGKQKVIGQIPSHEFVWGCSAVKDRISFYDSGPNSTEVATTYRVSLTGVEKIGTHEPELSDYEFGKEDGLYNDTLFASRKASLPYKKE